MKWSGYMNSRVKHLTSRMHGMHGQMNARPWPKEFKIPMCGSSVELWSHSSRTRLCACIAICLGNSVREIS